MSLGGKLGVSNLFVFKVVRIDEDRVDLAGNLLKLGNSRSVLDIVFDPIILTSAMVDLPGEESSKTGRRSPMMKVRMGSAEGQRLKVKHGSGYPECVPSAGLEGDLGLGLVQTHLVWILKSFVLSGAVYRSDR